MNDHPTWCHPQHCTVLGPNQFGIQRGGAHRSAPVDLGKDAEINGRRGPLTAQLQQASRTASAPVTLLLTTGGQPISLVLDPADRLGRLLHLALTQ